MPITKSDDDNVNTDDNKTIAKNETNVTPTPKITFALNKKKSKKEAASTGKKKAKEFQTKNGYGGDGDEDQYTTIAEAAINETKRRKELGEELVIPLEKGNGVKKNEPLLSGFQRIIQGKLEKSEKDDDKEEEKNDDKEENEINERDQGKDEKRRIEHGNSSVTNDMNDNGKDSTCSIDKEAEDALIQLATENKQSKENYNNSDTNFLSGGPSSLVIKQQKQQETKKQDGKVDETIKYKRDLEHRADDISVQSQAYVKVPIAEFGAAMLRGMGWKTEQSNNDDKKKEKEFNPRPHRLGLGATPLPPSMKTNNGDGGRNKRHRARKGGTMDDIAKANKEEEEERIWKQKMEEKKRNDVQITLQVGSIVRLRNDDDDYKRAKMIKIAGVPGLNRVLIRYEGKNEDVSVKKSDVILVDKAHLEKDPFYEKAYNRQDETQENQSSNTTKTTNRRESENEDRRRYDKKDRRRRSRSTSRNRSYSRSRSRSRSQEKKQGKKDRSDRRSRRDRNQSREKSSEHRKSSDRKSNSSREKKSSHKKSRRDKDEEHFQERNQDRKSSRRSHEKRKRHYEEEIDKINDNKHRDKKRSKYENEQDSRNSSEHWLTPNIRVRVVTNKVARGRQYKQKGVVIDVLNQGSHAVLHMDNGEVIDRIPERYLETALPKVGGHAIILTGSFQFAKGKLLERSTSKGNGVVQLFEDMNVVTLSLDDIAEWCGSLDDEHIH